MRYFKNVFEAIAVLLLMNSCSLSNLCSTYNLFPWGTIGGEKADWVEFPTDSIVSEWNVCKNILETKLYELKVGNENSNPNTISAYLHYNKGCFCNSDYLKVQKEEDPSSEEFVKYMPPALQGSWQFVRVYAPRRDTIFETETKRDWRLPHDFRIYQTEGYLLLIPISMKYEMKRYRPFHTQFAICLYPGLTEYTRSIKLIWYLYRLNLFYELDSSAIETFQKEVHSIEEKVGHHTGFGLYAATTKSVRESLEDDLKKGGSLYKSYFELVFWDIYKPQNFVIKKNWGAVRKMNFYSRTMKKHYQVRFNIDYPFCFKVKEL